jgi:cytochrome P450
MNSFPIKDLTYEELTNEAPLLDAVVHETLRLHPPVLEMWRSVRPCCRIMEPFI